MQSCDTITFKAKFTCSSDFTPYGGFCECIDCSKLCQCERLQLAYGGQAGNTVCNCRTLFYSEHFNSNCLRERYNARIRIWGIESVGPYSDTCGCCKCTRFTCPCANMLIAHGYTEVPVCTHNKVLEPHVNDLTRHWVVDDCTCTNCNKHGESTVRRNNRTHGYCEVDEYIPCEEIDSDEIFDTAVELANDMEMSEFDEQDYTVGLNMGKAMALAKAMIGSDYKAEDFDEEEKKELLSVFDNH